MYRLRVFCVKSCQVASLAVRQQITWSAWIHNHLQSPPLPNADAQQGQHKLQSETVWQTPTYGSCSNSDPIPTISNCQENNVVLTLTALRYWGQLRKPTSVWVGWCRFGSPKYIVVQISLMPGFTDTLSIIPRFWIMKHLNTQVPLFASDCVARTCGCSSLCFIWYMERSKVPTHSKHIKSY